MDGEKKAGRNSFRPAFLNNLVSYDVEINPRFYRGKEKERSCDKKQRASCKPQKEMA